jgi:hypothetical protein
VGVELTVDRNRRFFLFRTLFDPKNVLNISYF